MNWRKTKKVMPPRAVATNPPAFLKAVLHDLKKLDLEMPSTDKNMVWICDVILHVLNTTLDNIYELERHQYDVCKSGAVSDEARTMIMDMMWQQKYMTQDMHELQEVLYRITGQVEISENSTKMIEAMARMGELTSEDRTFNPGDDQPVGYPAALFNEYGYTPTMQR